MARALWDVYTEEPFLGTVGSYLEKYCDPGCQTAYVAADMKRGEDQKLLMGYNPKFLFDMPHEHRKSVCKHEYYHIALLHILGRQPTDPKEHYIFNVSADLVVNFWVAHNNKGVPIDPKDCLPSTVFFPGKFPEGCKDIKFGNLIATLPVNESMEFYFGKLKTFVEENPEFEGANGTLDDHSLWGGGEADEDCETIMRQRIEGIVEAGTEAARINKHWGSVPKSMQAVLEKLFQKEVDWKAIIRMFFGRIRSTELTSTVRRLNKKFPGMLPGTKKKTRAAVAFFIDQSGSMSNKDVTVGFSEVSALSKLTEIDVYNFDTQVDKSSHKVWKSGKVHEWGRTRSGGTDFNCVRDFCALPENRNKWTGIVIYTDGYADALKAMPPGIRVLWVITPGGAMNVVREGDLVVQLKGV